jgi:signal transduction histidine kinase
MGVYSSQNETQALFWARAGFIGIVFIPVLTYHFAYSFLNMKRTRILIWLYFSIVPLILIGQTPHIYSGAKLHYWGYYPTAGFWYILPVTLYVGIFSRVIWVLYKAMGECRQRGEDLRYEQIKYLLLGFAFGSLGIVDYVAKFGIEIYPFGYAVAGIFILLNAYAMIRYRLMDIKTVIHKTAMWIAMSSFIAIPLSALFSWKFKWLAERTPFELFLLVDLLLLLSILYFRIVQPRIDHLFQRRKYNMQALLEGMIRELASLKNVDNMIDKLVLTIQGVLYVSNISLVLWNDKDQQFKIVKGRIVGEEGTITADHPFLSWLVEQDRIIERDEIEFNPKCDIIRPFARSYLNKFDATVVLPLVHDQKLIGLINLGDKINLKPFSNLDIQFLSNLRAEASIALSNYLLYDDVSKLSNTLLQWADELEQRVAERTRQLGESNRQLEESNQKLRELDELKTKFFDNISHELRTPLTLILAPAEMMLNLHFGSLTAAQEKYLGIMQTNALRLLKLINNLLDLAKIDAGKMDVCYEQAHFVEFVKKVVFSVIPLAEKKGLNLFLECDDEIPEFFFDADKIEKVILNLLSNAVKFTERGEVKVTCFRKGDVVVVNVSDSGIGFSKDDIPKLFGRFVQVDHPERGKNDGTGIGLALVKELIDLMGGNIWVESKERGGATFSFSLPIYHRLEEVPDETDRKTAAHSAVESAKEREWSESWQGDNERSPFTVREELSLNGRGDRPRILLVDDNVEMRHFISSLLRESYDLRFAKDGKEGADRARADLPDLIISDVMMPLKDGFQLCKDLKQDPGTSHIPLLLLTAKADFQMKLKGLECGADDYLSKPFSSEELRVRIKSLLNLRVQ